MIVARRRDAGADAGRPAPAIGRTSPASSVDARASARRRATATIDGRATIASPDEPKRPIIGIAGRAVADIELPVDVDIDLGDVGGPSAGLAFALDVMEELGRDVDRGHKVAATGELELDGSVAPIGGIKQKAIGARRAGVDVFLVPAGENAARGKAHMRATCGSFLWRAFNRRCERWQRCPEKR